MNGVEIILITSVLLLLIIWIWFIVLGFRTSRLWGAGLIFLFPFSPFMFAYRFERKTRQTIYYFIGSLLFFVSVLLYINFATSVDFYDMFWAKLRKGAPSIDFSSKPAPVKKLNLPPPTPIPAPRVTVPEVKETVPAIKKYIKPQIQNRKYRNVDIGSVGSYIGKNVIVTTATSEQEGRLISVSATSVEIKMKLGKGGAAQIRIPKSRIEKIQVYL